MPKFYDVRRIGISDARPLFAAHHAFAGVGRAGTYTFGFFEGDVLKAAFVFNPPIIGAAKNICPEAPHGVLALARMVAVPKSDRAEQNIADVLRYICGTLIDRTRWPVLVSYADTGAGHSGAVYRYAGWQMTREAAAEVCEDERGARRSKYTNGKRSKHAVTGTTTLRRFEHRICPPGDTALFMARQGWRRVTKYPKKFGASPRHVWQRARILSDDDDDAC